MDSKPAPMYSNTKRRENEAEAQRKIRRTCNCDGVIRRRKEN